MKPKTSHRGLERLDLPTVDYRPREPLAYVCRYGLMRGSRAFASEQEAKNDLVEFIDWRTVTLIRQLDALQKLKRKLSK